MRSYSTLVGTGLMLLASTAYNSGVVLRAAAVRKTPHRATSARRTWLAGGASIVLMLVGWCLEFGALLYIPLTLARVLNVAGLAVLAELARRMLHEPLGRRELYALLMIAVGMAGVSIAPPELGTASVSDRQWLFLLLILGAATIGLFALRGRGRRRVAFWAMASGMGYALSGILTKGAADALSGGALVSLSLLTVGVALAGLAGFLIEVAAIREYPVSIVAPIVLAVQTLVPIAVAPIFFHERWPSGVIIRTVLAGGILLMLAGALALGANHAPEQVASA